MFDLSMMYMFEQSIMYMFDCIFNWSIMHVSLVNNVFV